MAQQGQYSNVRETMIEIVEFPKKDGGVFEATKTFNLNEIIDQVGNNVQMKLVHGRKGTENEGRTWIKLFESNFQPKNNNNQRQAQRPQYPQRENGANGNQQQMQRGGNGGARPTYNASDRRGVDDEGI